MNNILNIKTPAEGQAAAIRSDYGLDNIGLSNLRKVYWNLPTEALYEEIIFRGEGHVSHMGPVIVNTGKHTARAANDKFVVRETTTEENIWWGQYNRPFAPEKFNELFNRLQGYLQGRDIFVQDCYGGADAEYRLPVRIVTELAWHSLFARNMFINPQTAEEYRRHAPEFTVIVATGFKAFPQIDQTPSETFIVLNFAQKLCIIGNTAYGGEIKKSVFTLLNYLLPLHDSVMTMHCSANVGKDGDVALFFGLSGTGKTTLSADPARGLIGDDEHGWSDNGVFNFEGGCYAKVIELSPAAEPQIYACTRRFGAILENVIYDPVTRFIDLDDASITENTRASYPLDFIENAVATKRGGHPKNIIFLTCDASGVMPPIARLSLEQAMYHFISGYTSKIAGTEIGLREEPEITFSPCFGGPFMVHTPSFYADLLRRKIERYGVKCWLVNTGWVGGPYGVGKRISIRHTRNLLNAALSGALEKVEYYTDPVFGFEVPKTCPEVPEEILYPAQSWRKEEEYWKKYKQLASRFIDNMKKFEADTPREVVEAGPRV
ncbi:phosphoenolpyruvate carboxykinase (ATP) [bacterium]|nr:phosphoenolpyruvate carboxykinase (ATP) [bacterium]OIO86091.1 MAG: phosphoenolpyruvate carboxykinase (ATP) [Anaerolineae bacterium CG2_30_58_95]PIW20265.1 MAG: phosphoenolpyruvate carboxykinase (ATP) [Anaerolineae bacterium CG17_big_fil_post_rev_8_21_14_2_50_57_27]PJH75084.1 MAG: phosphoenolpyruvate carboxykinase (ATP) [Anaerolineae bacterium CG_4_9_14_0_8_um_filter_58_9]